MARLRWNMVLLLWLVLLIAIACRSAWSPQRNSVYPIYADAGRNWLAGQTCYGYLRPDHDIFRFSPVVAAAFVPFGMLPDPVGGPLWLLLNAGVFCLGLLCFVRTMQEARLDWAILGLAVLPWALPSFANLQANPLVIGLLLAGTAACRARRWNVAAMALTAASLIKLYPLAYALLLAVVYPRKLSVRLVVALLVGLGLPFVMHDADYVTSQWQIWRDDLARYHGLRTAEWHFVDFGLLLHGLGISLSPVAWATLQVSSGLALAGFVWLWCRSSVAESAILDRVHTLGACWMVLFGPGSESPTYTLLAPAFAIACAEAWRSSSRPWFLMLLFGLMLLRGLSVNVPLPAFINLSNPLIAVLFAFERIWTWSCASEPTADERFPLEAARAGGILERVT